MSYTYSVIQKGGRENPRDPRRRDDHILVSGPGKTPIEMRGETLAEAPEDGAYQIRVDGPGGTEFLPWEDYRAGQVIVIPKDLKGGV